MKKNIVIFLMIFCTFLLQSVWTKIIPVMNITPNFLLILTVSLAFMRGRRAGMLTGFIGGLLYDLFCGSLFGFTALILLYIGFVIGSFYKVFFDTDIRMPMFFVAAGDLVYGIVFYVFQFALRQRSAFPAYLKQVILPELVLTVVLTIVCYAVYYAVNKKISAFELEEEQSPWLRE